MAKTAILHNNIDRTRNYALQRENIVGRSVDSQVYVDDRRVSRRHARIARVARSKGYFIEDISARGVYVNFKRIQGRQPLREADRICILMFHNVHPLEIERMTPDVLKESCDDPRNHNIQPLVDLTFGYVDPADMPPVLGETPGTTQEKADTDDTHEKTGGLLDRIKGLLAGSGKKPKRKKEPTGEWQSSRGSRYKL